MRAVASDWSSSTAWKPSRRSASASDTVRAFDAFATTMNRSAARRYTIRSSRMPPSGAQIIE